MQIQRIRDSRASTSLLTAATLTLMLVLGLADAARAGAVEATIVDTKGDPVEDAVLLAFPAAPVPRPSKPAVVDVDQVEKEFVPRVSAVLVGTPIRFPNYDQIRHHVYSFSPTKTFEIPLYKGIPAEPIVFDQAGVVTLGCNIHDWMQGWVLVTETVHTAVSDERGRAVLDGLPAGAVRLRVWHPDLKGRVEDTEQPLELAGSAREAVAFEIDRKKAFRPRRGGRSRDRY